MTMSMAVFGGGGMGNPNHSPRMSVRRHHHRPAVESPLIHDEHASRRDSTAHNHRPRGSVQAALGALLIPENEVGFLLMFIFSVRLTGGKCIPPIVCLNRKVSLK